ncbi:MAG: sulfatase-like hydrolase/transferase [Verrucomicrobiota bacterium]
MSLKKIYNMPLSHLLLMFALIYSGLCLKAQNQPNILWLVSEDNGPYLGAYGDTSARTPTIDSLATDGIRFDNAFANAPVCAVARFSLITGLHGIQFAGPGEMRNEKSDFKNDITYWPKYLRDAGYYTSNSGKTDYNPTINSLRNAAWNKNGNNATWMDRSANQPFFAVFNQNNTHESNHFLDGVASLNTSTTTNPDTLDLPPIHADTFVSRITWANFHDRMELMDNWVAGHIQDLENAGILEDTIIFYYGDHGGPLPGGKRHVNDFGLRVPLIVRIPSNWTHLFSLPRGSVVDEPVSFLDLPTTVLDLAGESIPSQLQGRIAFGVNKETVPNYIPFYRGRMDERIALVRGVHNDQYRYIRNYLPKFPVGRQMVFRQNSSLAKEWVALNAKDSLTAVQMDFFEAPPYEELYDFQADPWESNNLVDDPTYASILAEMRTATDTFILSNRDTGFIPEGTSTYSHSLVSSEANYPLTTTIFDLAGKAASGDPANLADLITALSDSNYIVRFWGAMGCATLGTEATPAITALENLLSDGEPRVAAAAAYALLEMNQTANALTTLQSQIQTENGFDLLFAIEIADRVDDLALPLLTTMQTRQSSNEFDGLDATDPDFYAKSLLDTVVSKLGDGPSQSPFGGTARAIPGRIEAEDFDEGLQFWAYNDQDTGNDGTGSAYRSGGDTDIYTNAPDEYQIGKTRDGEFLEYTVDVVGGQYEINVLAASGNSSPGELRLKLNGDVLGTVDITNTGDFTTFSSFTLSDVPLAGGTGLYLRLEIIGGSFDIDAIEFTRETYTSYDGWSREVFDGQLFRDDDTGPEVWSDDKDPDGDRIPNLAEAAMGTLPMSPNTAISSVSNGLSGSLSFQHPYNLTMPADITTAYQWSSDLSSWYASGENSTEGKTVTIIPTLDSGTTSVIATPNATMNELFVRPQFNRD